MQSSVCKSCENSVCAVLHVTSHVPSGRWIADVALVQLS